MSRQRRHDISHDIYMRLHAQYAAGRGHSRHADKATGADVGRIYSQRTYQTYRDQGKRFAEYAKGRGCRTLVAARVVVPEYLQCLIDRGLSSYSVRTAASALGKIYGVDYGTFGVDLPRRARADITQNRGVSKQISRHHISAATAEQYGSILRCCGLRRSEALAARGTDLRVGNDGRYMIDVPKGKGGKHRTVDIIGTPAEIKAVVNKFRDAGNGLVWAARIPKDIPIHRYRAQYAERAYKAVARPLEALDRHGIYYCRGDMAGTAYDRQALDYVSRQLGHNRISVVAAHYMHGGV